MEYDRVQLKLAAKAAIRQARPNPRWVTLVLFLITAVLPSLLMTALFYPMLRTMAWQDAWISTYHYHYSGASFGPFAALSFFFTIFAMLFVLVISYGYANYGAHVWRGQESGYRDLFFGFSQMGRVLALTLKIMLFSVLWALLGTFLLAITGGLCSVLAFLVASVLPSLGVLISVLLPSACLLGFYAFLLSRTLRYALAPLILLDKPSYLAGEALDESKDLMVGHRCKLLVLTLSFLGWGLLIMVIFSLTTSACLFLFRWNLSFGTMVPALLSWAISTLASLPLILWLTPYTICSYVGFYEAVSQNPGVPSPLLPRPEDPWER